MISFDVVSLFTNVPLDATIDIILRRIYDDKEINTDISRTDMKQLLLICTKDVHFTFNNEIYKQKDGVAMGSPLGPVLAGIFMVELERKVVPTIVEVKLWKRYVDDTIAVVKIGCEEYILSVLNSFHKQIQFTYESEENDQLPFLDVLLHRSGDNILTSVYRKKTNSDLYIHWESFAPSNWKTGTIRTLVRRAYNVCSNQCLLDQEIEHLTTVFQEKNGYPKWIIDKVVNEVRTAHELSTNHEQVESTENENETERIEKLLIIPYAGTVGCNIMKKMKKDIKQILPENVTTQIVYTSSKLKSQLRLKDAIPKHHKHNVVYKFKCNDDQCNQSYIGECARRLGERVKDHQGRDSASHIFTHTEECCHSPVTIDNFTIIGNNYRSSRYRRIAEALTIKQQNPALNVQEKSVPLRLLS